MKDFADYDFGVSVCSVAFRFTDFFFFIALGIVDEKGPLLSVSSQERETVKEGQVSEPEERTWFRGTWSGSVVKKCLKEEETLEMGLLKEVFIHPDSGNTAVEEIHETRRQPTWVHVPPLTCQASDLIFIMTTL